MGEKEDYTKDKGDTGAQGPQGDVGPQGPQGDEGPPGTTTWAGITDKPSEFPPEDHGTNHEKGGSDETPGFATATKAAWSKSIGPGGDYATWAAMMADMLNLIAHAVTVTIKVGTTLTETCDLKNKHGLTTAAAITVQAEKYFPTSGVLPTADSATATTLRDAALATAALGNDYFNGCWIFVVDGTGTNNGFVPITDYVDATGDVVVASWPGTQPDNTSRYLIVGALVDGGGTKAHGLLLSYNTIPITFKGIGITDTASYGLYVSYNSWAQIEYCGVDKADYSGIFLRNGSEGRVRYCGMVGNNTINSTIDGGIVIQYVNYGHVFYCGISDNSRYGIRVRANGFGYSHGNFGDGNGVWGGYATESGHLQCVGSECSGSSGNHSNGVGDGSLAY